MMLYRVEVFDDGDIFVSKRIRKMAYDTCLYLDSVDSLAKELEDYGVSELEEDLASIEAAPLNTEVRCY